ncbi:MAG: hypothetical protein MI749_05200, partial [Desulfovibrionales bacterium]|nr:hypothetical protein [Desulfovibrionales bacterium]
VAHGYAPSRDAYLSWLKKGRVVVSTAVQENFGISVVEAVRHGCFPLLPRRLSYPEIMPRAHHREIFYTSVADLAERLAHCLETSDPAPRRALANYCGQYAWESLIPQYDELFSRVAGG